MYWVVKRFEELTASELWEIYKLRVDVFIVEQACAYHEVDEFDKCAYHVYLKSGNNIEAYLRVLPKGSVFEEVSIGRVIAVKRNCGLGTKVVQKGIEVAENFFGAKEILIEAQTYARRLYEKLGFVQVSEEFLEDGIPHIKMRLIIEEKNRIE